MIRNRRRPQTQPTPPPRGKTRHTLEPSTIGAVTIVTCSCGASFNDSQQTTDQMELAAYRHQTGEQ